MSADFSTTENIAFQDGELVDAADMLTEAQAARNRSQELAAAILGVMDWIPGMDALQVQTDGSFQVTVGGADQRIFVQGAWCDNCPATQLQCPGSGPVQRIDSIAIKAVPLAADGNTITREDEASDGSKSNVAIPLDANTIALQYVQGSETPPPGYVEFARVTVPANATGLNAADIEIVLPDPRKAITGTDSTPVTTVNGQQGDVVLEGEGNVVVDLDGAKVRITGTPTSVNGNTGAVTIEGDGQITVTEDGPGKVKINAPAAVAQTTINGNGGAVTLEGSGIASVTPDGAGKIKINVPAPPAPATINGDGPQAFILADGDGVHVRRESAGVFAFDNDGVTGLNGQTGDVQIESSDGLLNVAPSAGTVNLTQKNIPIGGALFAQGAGLAGSITLPNYGTWGIEVLWAFTQQANVNAEQTISLTQGAVTGIGNTGDGFVSYNSTAYGSAMFCGTAVANQKLSFNFSSNQALNSSAWTIKAFRLS